MLHVLGWSYENVEFLSKTVAYIFNKQKRSTTLLAKGKIAN